MPLSLTMSKADIAVASTPALMPPYQALTITAAKNRTKGLSCSIRGATSSFSSSAIATADTATPQHRHRKPFLSKPLIQFIFKVIIKLQKLLKSDLFRFLAIENVSTVTTFCKTTIALIAVSLKKSCGSPPPSALFFAFSCKCNLKFYPTISVKFDTTFQLLC